MWYMDHPSCKGCVRIVEIDPTLTLTESNRGTLTLTESNRGTLTLTESNRVTE